MVVSSVHLTEFLDAVAISGNRFGLSLHTDKFQLIQVNCNSAVYLPSGAAVPAEATLGYLGTTLSHDGHINSELARRLGMARADYESLTKVWRHFALGRKWKLSIYHSLVESKLLYGLATMCLNIARESDWTASKTDA